MTHQRKILIGFSLALTIALTVGFLQLVVLVQVLHAHSHLVALAVALLGLAFLVLGRNQSDNASQQKTLTLSEIADEHPLGFFKKLRYWGYILFVAAVTTSFVNQYRSTPLVVAPKPTLEPKVAEAAPAPEPAAKPAAPPKFPKLILTGMICNGPRSTAAINGQTVKLGERIEGVKVVAIERWGITVEMGDHERHFAFRP